MYPIEWPYKQLLDELHDGVYFLDKNRNIIYWNKSAEMITGFTSEAALAHLNCCTLLVHADKHGEIVCNDKCPASLTLLDGQLHSSELFFRHKDGYLLAVSIKTFPLRTEIGEIIGAVAIFIDNSPREALFRELEQLRDRANFDQLTSIYNRSYGETLIAAKLVEHQKGDRPIGILFVDIDKFKGINDTYGHAIGDLVLKTVAKTLSNSIRNNDYVIRWGGEEILVLLTGNFNLKGLERVAHKLRILVEQSNIYTCDHTIQVTVSLGATLARQDDTVDTLVNRADHLMYQSKKAGRNCVTIG
ncbi:sensor domain-containing diguanylate cyclase [Pelosinus propionicus]|uniref:PAS domain S-box-containing protein/diguanylate cyclase (GGDEF) domain-containing protein n=1 Tax=Pelosinus propionicus DSM 13327 TaxID=1123291 RepID=A0A1I4PC25_9FIRM|nr:sensor domain-containing diguanylate cyclase [Pelosinus propionicus]SFM24923.1 PAS domain S-box-containing protein/diguanylate cyclase (GGDEF) domain-containing protein [Pelosinus propionicus DSM 13327]